MTKGGELIPQDNEKSGLASSAWSLSGKTALVTGSSRGIGRAILLALSEAGANVIVHGVNDAEHVSELVGMARKRGGTAEYVAADLSDLNGARSLGKAALRMSGQVDILVLNASLQIRNAWEEITSDEYEAQMRVNFQSSLELLQLLTPQMRERRWGRVLSIGSVQERLPHSEMLIYAASKVAQSHLVLSLARQLAPYGVTANNLAPGVVKTDRNARALADDGYAESVRSKIPVGFFGEVSDCVGAALLLCSDAGRYITGQNLFVDGGMSL